MTHDKYKAALNVLNKVFPAETLSFVVNGRRMKSDSGCEKFVPIDHLEQLGGEIMAAIRSALQLAQEAEQMRKERDDLKAFAEQSRQDLNLLLAKLEKAKDVLRFYEEQHNYRPDRFKEQNDVCSPIDRDAGHRARIILEEIK